MERHDAMTRRPSLLAGGHEPTHGATPPGRILPSIDASDARAPVRARPWWLAVALLATAALAVVLLARPSTDPRTTAPVAGVAGPSAPGAAAGAATIIEEQALPTEVALGPSSLPTPDPAPGSVVDSPFAAMAHSGTGGVASNPFVDRREAKAPAPARPHAADTPAEAESPALLATLLGHIHARPAPESGMDRLVGQLAGKDGASAQAGTQASPAGAEFRSHQIQMNLRDCPPANTAEGVACRRGICEVYAGRDPACPAG